MCKFFLGIDLGGTNVRFVTSDAGSDYLHSVSDIVKKPVERCGDITNEVEENIFAPIESICKQKVQEGKVLAGIGIAMAALFDRTTGDIVNWPNNKCWNGFPLKIELEKRYQVPVVLEDDANAAALGELIAGEGKGYHDLAYVTISTGIGCGIVVNNSVFTGSHGWAGELGHIKVTDMDVTCTCGAKGCLQAIASGPAILRHFVEKDTCQMTSDGKKIALQDVSKLAEDGVQEAQEVFLEAGSYIGKALANLVMLFDIPLIVLGGGVMESGPLIYHAIVDSLQRSLENKRAVQIAKSSLQDRNGILGALYLVEKNIVSNMLSEKGKE